MSLDRGVSFRPWAVQNRVAVCTSGVEILQNDLIAQKTFFSRTEGFVWNFFIVSIYFVFWHNCLQCNAHHRRIMNTGKSGILMALNACFFRYHFVFYDVLVVDVLYSSSFAGGRCWCLWCLLMSHSVPDFEKVHAGYMLHHKIWCRADTSGTTLVGSLNFFPGSICAKFWGPMKINPRFIF